jgi:predicted ATP-dependent protease
LFTDASNRKPIVTDRIKITLAIALGIVVIAAGFSYIYQNMKIGELDSELILKSRTLDERESQILLLNAEISSQTRQIEEKNAQLEQLDSQVSELRADISSKDAEIEEQDLLISSKILEIQSLQSQSLVLQAEIDILQDEIQENADEIALLSGRVRDTEEQLQSFERTRVRHFSLAIDQNDNGRVLPIEVEIIPSGDGSISIDVKNVQYETGFQTALRDAVKVASDYSDVEVSDKDIIVRVINEFDDPGGELTIDGGSAGALIAAMIISGLVDEQMDSSVLITGTIEPDGSVGAIGGLEEKAATAADFGAETLLVPEDQEFEDTSIEIVGVSDIDDVMKYIVR